MKRPLASLAALALCLAAFPASGAAAAPAVVPSAQNLTVDGKAANCEAYNIDGANYFKLRDLSCLLMGTGSRFSVGWDAASGTVSVTTGADYAPAGGELDRDGDRSATAVPSSQSVVVDGKALTGLSVYNIGGSNYFKLRDLGAVLGFAVDYDAATNTAAVTSVGPVHKTPEAQIDLLLARRGLWYQGGSPDYYPAYLYYAVTDLNQNGRLELLCSEFRYDTNTNIHHFYEVDPSETAVTELYYDLAGDAEPGSAPGLVNAQLPALCFFRDGAYHYSVPTPGEPDENLDIEYFYVLSMDRDSRVTTELLGQKWVDHVAGKTSYLRGLDEIGQREYDTADLTRFAGDNCCQVAWEWVMLMEGWDEENFREELRGSWNGFRFDTLGLLP